MGWYHNVLYTCRWNSRRRRNKSQMSPQFVDIQLQVQEIQPTFGRINTMETRPAYPVESAGDQGEKGNVETMLRTVWVSVDFLSEIMEARREWGACLSEALMKRTLPIQSPPCSTWSASTVEAKCIFRWKNPEGFWRDRWMQGPEEKGGKRCVSAINRVVWNIYIYNVAPSPHTQSISNLTLRNWKYSETFWVQMWLQELWTRNMLNLWITAASLVKPMWIVQGLRHFRMLCMCALKVTF